MPPDIQNLRDQLDRVANDARSLVSELSEEQGLWRRGTSWSVAECLAHLAITNRVYLSAMEEAALQARNEGRMRSGPARPGWFGGWFARRLEPPVKIGMKTPKSIRPPQESTLDDSFSRFVASQAEVIQFLSSNADLDLSGIRFRNPFVRGLRFSLASGFQVIAAHERRHVWQARRVRDELKSDGGPG